MVQSTKTQFGLRRSDGFATLTGNLLERRGMGAPSVEQEREVQHTSECNARLSPSLSNERSYAGPERRVSDISPVIERRRSRPPRIKVSVRLERHRHDRLKAAALLQTRTHQDLMTAALDCYLDRLNIPKMGGGLQSPKGNMTASDEGKI